MYVYTVQDEGSVAMQVHKQVDRKLEAKISRGMKIKAKRARRKGRSRGYKHRKPSREGDKVKTEVFEQRRHKMSLKHKRPTRKERI
jgi:hypothetical protein